MAGPLQNLRHERFCRELAAGEGLASAYVRAGFKDSPNARFNASRLRNTPDCRRRIDELAEQFAEHAALKLEYLQAQLLQLLQANAQDLFDAHGNPRPIHELPRDLAAVIKSVTVDPKTGEFRYVLPDKVAVGALLLKSAGHLKEDPAIALGVNISLTDRLDRAVARRRALPAAPRLVEEAG